MSQHQGLAKLLGWDAREVRKRVRKLRKLGVIDVEIAPDGTNMYRINWDVLRRMQKPQK